MAEYGLEVLFEPGEESDGADLDIVFVHGISGNRYSTWTKNGVLWPQALLPEDVRKARILTAGYSADVASIDADHELEETTIKHHATDICERLSLLRTETNSTERSVIFVAHSTGGYICAQIFINGKGDLSDQNAATIAHSTQGILFLATPFATRMLPNIIATLTSTNFNTTQEIEKNYQKSLPLWHFRKDFIHVLQKHRSEGIPFGIVFFFEALADGKSVIVDETSGCIPGFGQLVPIRADHNNICKIETREEDGYGIIVWIRKLRAGELSGPSSDPIPPPYTSLTRPYSYTRREDMFDEAEYGDQATLSESSSFNNPSQNRLEPRRRNKLIFFASGEISQPPPKRPLK